ncbi:MAG: FAD-dependent oxidoreductase [Candidatus Excrementavichristensenella sp.]|jgi:flavocytochrome c
MNRKKVFLSLLLAAAMALGAFPALAQEAQADLLVIGAGISGLTAAIEAADIGIENIVLIDKLAYVGGSAFVSAGILGGYETQKTKPLDLHVDPKDMYAEQMREKHYTLDPELTWITTEKSGETIDWLIDRIGVPFLDEVGTKDGYGTLETIHQVEGGGVSMRAPYMDALAALPQIHLEIETRATSLIVEDGKVVGAVVDRNGEISEIRADAVILCTGGYSSNRELFARLHPANAVFQQSAMPGSTGDGLMMATAVGAAVNNIDQLQVYLREYNDMVSQTPYLYNLFVGLEGKRFMDEKRTAQTYNQEIKDDIVAQYGRDGVDYFYAINDHAAMEMFDLVEDAQTRPGVVIAETLEALAEKTGMDAEGLKQTVETWNQSVAAGADAQFGRTRSMMPIGEGPYYALQTTFFSSVCHGGIVRNALGEVVRSDGTAIPGLYASGEVTANASSNGYTISGAVTWGRIAARSAAAYITE